MSSYQPAGASLTHTHRTFHLAGDRDALGALARTVLGVDLHALAR